MTVVAHLPYFSLFPWLKLKLEGSHFDTIEVLTEQDFQDAFKTLQKCWEWCIHALEDYFEGDGGQ
jgi:hypothetical protein